MKALARYVAPLLLSALGSTKESVAAQSPPCGVFSFASGADPDGDLPHHGGLCLGVAEEDFEAYANGASVAQIALGSMTIDVNMVDDHGNLLADDASIFASASFNVPEVMYNNALLNRGLSGAAGRIEFVFSSPAESFGAWMFDDFGADDPLTFEVLEADGSLHVEGPMHLNPGSGIEGFFGYRSCVGIQRVRIGIASSYLEFDHIQVGGIPASRAVVRNGLGVNRACYAAVPPGIGKSWSATVDVSAHPGATLVSIAGYGSPLAGRASHYGELLVDSASPRLFRSYAIPIGGMASYSYLVPANPCLAGRTIYTQAVILGGRAELCNAVDLTIGY